MKLDLEQDVKGLLPEKDFDRRDFIWTALGASAALALASPASAQQVVTDANGLDAADVMIPVKDGQIRGYRAMPATGGPFPVVLVAAEIFGLNPYIKDVAGGWPRRGITRSSPICTRARPTSPRSRPWPRSCRS